MLALVTGSGRCGTNSLTSFLDGQRQMDGRKIVARHETDWLEIVADILRGREDLVDCRLSSFDHDIEVSPFLSLLRRRPLASARAQVRLVGLIRDGRQTVRSGMTKGWYWNPERDPEHWVNLQPRFEGDRFEMCCQFWAWTYRRLAGWRATILRLEDLTDRPGRNRLLAELRLAESNESFPHQNRTEYGPPSSSPPEAEVVWPDPFSALNHWTRRQHEVFERYCGEVMDEYYPCWREGGNGS